MKKISQILLSLTVISYAAALLYYSKAVSEGIIEAFGACINVIIPSLFPFMIASGIIVSSNLYYIIGMPFSLASRYIFRTEPYLFSVFLISSVGGYPVGAKLLSELFESGRISREQAEKMLGFCYMGGPAFFIGAAGIKIYGSAAAGMVIFASIFLSNAVAMLLCGLRNAVPQKTSAKPRLSFELNSFISSINSGGIGIAKICAAILFFSSIISVLECSGIFDKCAGVISAVTHIPPEICKTLLRSVLEISNISSLPSDIGYMPITAAILSFGGFCVIIQTEGIIGGKLSTDNFLFSRIITMILSYFCCKILILVIGIENYIQVSSIKGLEVHQTSPISSLFLLIMTILLLSNNYIENIKKK